MYKKGAASVLMAVFSAIAILGGCGGDSGSAGKSPEASSPGQSPAQTGQASPKADFSKKITLTLFNSAGFNLAAPMPAREGDPLRQMLEAKVNVDLQMTLPPADQISTKLNTMIASGDIPDLVFFKDRNTAVQYFDQGVIVDVAPILAQYPALKSHYPETYWKQINYKGKTLGIPGYEMVQGIRGWWIRNDWLKNVNMKVPTTPEELMEVMKAFTFKDPDQNGQNDTYGFVGGVGKNGKFDDLGWDAIFMMFGVYQGNYEVVNGELVVHNADDRMKAAIAFIRQMLEAKVVDPDWTTINDIGALDNKMLGIGNVGIVYNDWRRMEGDKKEKNPEWIVIDPPKGPNGQQFSDLKGAQNNMWGISVKAAKDADKVARIMTLLEYWYTDKEAYPYFAYGPKGVFWELENGQVKYLSDKKRNVDFAQQYSWVSNYALPRRANDALYFNYNYPKTAEFLGINNKYLFPKGDNITPFITEDPSDTMYQDRIKYMDESLLKFISGKEPLTNWSTYVQTLETKFALTKFKETALKQLKEQAIIK